MTMTGEAILRPGSEAELAEAIRGAAGALVVRGGGTRRIGRPVAGTVLEVGGLAGVRLYEPGALTLVAGAGTPLAEVEAVLAAEGQRLAFEPPDYRALLGVAGQSTLGGVVAANDSGPRRVQAGGCRDYCLGVRFVDGAGAVVANGGRVMKNVTGYDLVKLMAGSRGTLGVMTEVALKVLPAPGDEASVVIEGVEAGAGVAAMSAALGSPFEVSGAAWLPGGRVALRLEGFAEQVAYRGAEVAALVGRFGPVARLGRDESRDLWRRVRDVADFAGQAGDLWRLSCRPSEAPGLVARAGGVALMDWGGARVWCLVPEGTDLRARLGAFAGHATRLRGAGPGPALPPEAPGVAALTQGLRARFDPRGILNPAEAG